MLEQVVIKITQYKSDFFLMGTPVIATLKVSPLVTKLAFASSFLISNNWKVSRSSERSTLDSSPSVASAWSSMLRVLKKIGRNIHQSTYQFNLSRDYSDTSIDATLPRWTLRLKHKDRYPVTKDSQELFLVYRMAL